MRPKSAIATLSILVLVLLAPLAYSDVPTAPQFNTNFYCILTQSSTNLGSCVEAAIPVAMLGVLLSLLFVALAYMLGNVLNMRSLHGWYTSELREAVISVLIIVLIFSVLLILSSIAYSFVSNTAPTITAANMQGQGTGIANNLQGMYNAIQQQYFTPEIQNAQNMFYFFFGLYDAIGFLQSFSLKLYIPIPITPLFTIGTLNFGFEENLYSSTVLVPLSSKQTSFIGDSTTLILIPVLTLLEVQQQILFYVIEVGLGVLLPIGIIARAIPFLRPLGGTLIALGIGSALVYPALLLFLNVPVTQYIAPIAQLPTQTPTATPTQGASQVMQNSLDKGSSYIEGIERSIASTQNAQDWVTVGFVEGLLSFVSIYPALNAVLSYGFINLALQFILFVFDLMIGVVITQDIGKVMGGKVSFGVGRLKLT